jgi:hypothetical protein
VKPILHIVKNPDDRQALETITRQARDNAYGVGVVLIHEAVSLPPIPDTRTCALESDVREGSPAPGVESISYRELLNLIFRSEAITVW